ncbi:LysR family transcriptional regulator [Achromobacter pestifer]|uniref:LysR family transcriptional regulator n=1 Tax=Achromobacter pestifer TaxID=1353889 RepID=A0A7D4I4L3_9BURK|nr:LysR family transcriptional regulator [Achromobacter pestifer]QKH33521.1 LysR family transcriptional regulator [Achromobacter pestifer]
MDLLATIRIYLRVVERGTISGAARDLDMSQPSVSERIDKLERFLSARLLVRSSRKLSCTAEGRTFYEQGKHLLDTAETTINSVTLSGSQIQGNLRLAAPQCLGEIVVPKALMNIRTAHPDLYMDVTLSDSIADPVIEGVDISLRLGRLNENGGYIAFPLGWVARKLVATPSYLAAHGPIATPADLACHPFIRLKAFYAKDQVPLTRENGPVVQTRIKTAMTVSHWRPMYDLILSGGGIGILQHPACAKALAQGRLVELLDDYHVPPLALNALIPPLRPLPQRVRVVLDLLKRDIPALLRPAV